MTDHNRLRKPPDPRHSSTEFAPNQTFHPWSVVRDFPHGSVDAEAAFRRGWHHCIVEVLNAVGDDLPDALFSTLDDLEQRSLARRDACRLTSEGREAAPPRLQRGAVDDFRET